MRDFLNVKKLFAIGKNAIVILLLVGTPITTFGATASDVLAEVSDIGQPGFSEPGISVPAQGEAAPSGESGQTSGQSSDSSGQDATGGLAGAVSTVAQNSTIGYAGQVISAVSNGQAPSAPNVSQSISLAGTAISLGLSLAGVTFGISLAVAVAIAVVAAVVSLFSESDPDESDAPDSESDPGVQGEVDASVDTATGGSTSGAPGSPSGAPTGNPDAPSGTVGISDDPGAPGITGDGSCFTAETLILTESVSGEQVYRKLGELKIGDIIAGVVFERGKPKLVPSKVLEVLTHEKKLYPFMELQTKNGSKLIGTSNHPVIIDSSNAAIQLEKLTGKEEVVSTIQSAAWDGIRVLKKLPGKSVAVFNLETETENYIVSADGNGGVLVHNGAGGGK